MATGTSRRQGSCVRRELVCLLLVSSAVTAVLASSPTIAHGLPRAFYGVIPQGPLSADDYQRMREARVDSVRVLVRWDQSEPCCNWAEYDAAIGQAAASGVEALPLVIGFQDGLLRPPQSPSAVQAWQAFLREFVGRYGRGGDFWSETPYGGVKPVRTIQIWNEPSSTGFWAGRPDAREYARLVIRSHEAIEQVDRRMNVMLAGLFAAPTRRGDRAPVGRYLKDLYRVRGIKKAFDLAAIHPYATTVKTLAERLDRVRKAMDEAGDRRTPLHVTELGWATGGPPGPFRESLKGQAKKLRQSFSLLKRKRRRWHVSGVNWFSWKDIPADTQGVCSFCPTTGLFREDGTPKPAWQAFRRFTR
jgi:hypothetical protein